MWHKLRELFRKGDFLLELIGLLLAWALLSWSYTNLDGVTSVLSKLWAGKYGEIHMIRTGNFWYEAFSISYWVAIAFLLVIAVMIMWNIVDFFRRDEKNEVLTKLTKNQKILARNMTKQTMLLENLLKKLDGMNAEEKAHMYKKRGTTEQK